jgi:hypothetical protein
MKIEAARLALVAVLACPSLAPADTATRYLGRHTGSAHFTSSESMLGTEDDMCGVSTAPMSGFQGASFDLFQFNLGPEVATIDGITVEVKSSASENCWGSVQLISYASEFVIAATGDLKQFAGTVSTDCADTEWFTTGGERDTWNVPVPLTRNIVNDPNFGLQILRVCSPGSNMLVDAARMTVHYNLPPPTTTTTGPTSTTTTSSTSSTTTSTTSITTTTFAPPACPAEPAACRSAEVSLVQFKRKDGSPDKNGFMWKWARGEATALDDLGTPTTDTAADFRLCIYDGAGSILSDVEVPGGPSSLWKATGTSGFLFKGDADGIVLLKAKAGAAGKSSMKIKGKGAGLFVPALPPAQSPAPLLVQLHSVASGTCFGAAYSAPALSDADDADSFKDEGD